MADEDGSLDELIEQAEALLEQEKPQKRKKGESEFEFYIDSITGHRESKRKYRPRHGKPSHSATCGSFEEASYDVSLIDEEDVEEQSHSNSEKDQLLESMLVKCQAVLDSFHSVEEINWERRMESLNENWEASLSLIFKAILVSQNPGIKLCDICHKAPCLLRCDESSGRRLCTKCDATIHEEHPFHDREALIDGSFKHIPPTVLINDDGKMEQTRKHLLCHQLLDLCPQCHKNSTLTVSALTGSVIVVNQKGRFDFNDYIITCNNCGHRINPWSLENIIAAGYWPGSPRDLTYLFDQNLFRQWDFIQKHLPGTSEVSFLKALGDLSETKGKASTITASTFSRSFKEWKFCRYEVQIAQGLSWMECPTCTLYQHSCDVDGNMKLYRYKSSGKQKRSCYYGNAFISPKNEVDLHIKNVYARAPRSKNGEDSMCGESHWKAAKYSARRRGKLDETGLEIAGCRHGLAQWAVNMHQGEIYGYAHYLQSKKMFPAAVKFFWEDVVCKYWKWAGKVGGSEMNMKPALSVMHAKAHKWSCQVLWGGRWQEGSAWTTGEEVEQINAHMSRCGNTTKYMLPEGRDELITEHALAWNTRKICAMVKSLKKRFTRAVAMCNSSKKECDALLEEYNFKHKDVSIPHWKEEIIKHSKDEELISNSRITSETDCDNLKNQMEMISFSIARTTSVINKQTDSSKQRTRFRKKIASEKTKLQALVEKYNCLVASADRVPLTVDAVLTKGLPEDSAQSGDVIPIRVKSKIVDAFEIHVRWMEELTLVKTEMVNFMRFYTEIRIPALQKEIARLENQLKSSVEHELLSDATVISNSTQVDTAVQTVQRYSSPENEPAVIQGKVALLRKGLFFCREQVKEAVTSFKKILQGWNVDIMDGIVQDCDTSDISEDENVDSDVDRDDDEGEDLSTSVTNHEIVVRMRPFDASNLTWIWEFPYSISQSTYQDRNGSNACSIIALLIAQGIHQVNVQLDPSLVLPNDWVTLVCGCIRVGNALYDHSRANLSQRYLSVAEAAMVAGNLLDVAVGQPLLVRVKDPHPPSTLRYHLAKLCNSECPTYSFALFVVNEKTVLFVGMGRDKLVLVDSHLYEPNGAIVILGKPCNVDNFTDAAQQSLGFGDSVFGNLVLVTL